MIKAVPILIKSLVVPWLMKNWALLLNIR